MLLTRNQRAARELGIGIQEVVGEPGMGASRAVRPLRPLRNIFVSPERPCDIFPSIFRTYFQFHLRCRRGSCLRGGVCATKDELQSRFSRQRETGHKHCGDSSHCGNPSHWSSDCGLNWCESPRRRPWCGVPSTFRHACPRRLLFGIRRQFRGAGTWYAEVRGGSRQGPQECGGAGMAWLRPQLLCQRGVHGG